MPRTLITLFLSLAVSLLLTPSSYAQNTRYVSDKLSVPLRSGPSGKYRVIHRGLPSGTRLTIIKPSEDGIFTEVKTARGTTGWMRSQYLMEDVPAQRQLDAALAKLEAISTKNAALNTQLASLQNARSELETQVGNTDSELNRVSKELADLKKISDSAVQLDIDNRRLVEEGEVLKSELERTEAENQRLNDKLNNSAFIDGALAVLLGVLIALLVPRLHRTKRRDSGWA